MLELQRFILRNIRTWKKQLSNSPYNLKIKEKDNLVLFKYSQFDSDFSLQIVREARGIILERDTWDVVSISFDKFFNLGEEYAATLDWQTAIGTEKMDGTLYTLYYYNNKWHIKTNGTIDAKDAPMESVLFNNWEELFNVAAANSGLDWSKLNKNYSYTFELCSKYNQVVVKYDEPKLYHILTRSNTQPYDEIETDVGVEKPRKYGLFNQESYEDYVEHYMDETHEGIVVRDQYGNRVKIKTKNWIKLHYLANNHNYSKAALIEKVLENDTDELIAYFPEYKEEIDTIKDNLQAIDKVLNNYRNITSNIKNDLAAEDKTESRKIVANSIKSLSKPSQTLFWLTYDDKVEHSVFNWQDRNKVIRLYKAFFDAAEGDEEN